MKAILVLLIWGYLIRSTALPLSEALVLEPPRMAPELEKVGDGDLVHLLPQIVRSLCHREDADALWNVLAKRTLPVLIPLFWSLYAQKCDRYVKQLLSGEHRECFLRQLRLLENLNQLYSLCMSNEHCAPTAWDQMEQVELPADPSIKLIELVE
jgi:hypothetical protein